jgi:hypothetical protein
MKWTLIALWGLMLLLGYTNPVLSGLLFFHRRHLGRADSFSHTIVRTISLQLRRFLGEPPFIPSAPSVECSRNVTQLARPLPSIDFRLFQNGAVLAISVSLSHAGCLVLSRSTCRDSLYCVEFRNIPLPPPSTNKKKFLLAVEKSFNEWTRRCLVFAPININTVAVLLISRFFTRNYCF